MAFRTKHTADAGDLRRLTEGEAPGAERKGHPPQKRGQCMQVQRPCPFVACRYHLFLNVTYRGGVSFPHGQDLAAIADMPTTCALDVAAGEPLTLTECGVLMNVNRERIRQIEEVALKKFRAYLQERGVEWSGESPAEAEMVGAPDSCNSERAFRMSDRVANGRRQRELGD